MNKPSPSRSTAPDVEDVEIKRLITTDGRAANTSASADASPQANAHSTSSAPPPTSAPAPPRLSLRFLLAHPAHLVALGGGSGLAPWAPGTFGTLWGWAVYVWVLQPWLDVAQIGYVIAASIPLGWWACTVTARNLGIADPGAVVWDEVVAIWLVLWLLMPASGSGQFIAFALFRFFDAAKPQPVRWADQCFKGQGWRGGWGIMWDDLVAAFCTLLVLAVLRQWGWLG